MKSKFQKFTILRTKAKPLSENTHVRHVVKISKMGNFRGGLTLVPNYFWQPSKHPDVSAKEWLVFLVRRKS